MASLPSVSSYPALRIFQGRHLKRPGGQTVFTPDEEPQFVECIFVMEERPGGQTVFTPDEEPQFVECIVVMGEYGFPVNTRELPNVIKNYLAQVGREVKVFDNNFPGTEWINSFVARHLTSPRM
ncbi:hypothetical protein QE152_g11281 [Popillia japonica]|uniref:Uncharacterized protein n=1 Tax=Popillia japonica TaxID=7064 RepID=A0AAW1LS03_POPJA